VAGARGDRVDSISRFATWTRSRGGDRARDGAGGDHGKQRAEVAGRVREAPARLRPERRTERRPSALLGTRGGCELLLHSEGGGPRSCEGQERSCASPCISRRQPEPENRGRTPRNRPGQLPGREGSGEVAQSAARCGRETRRAARLGRDLAEKPPQLILGQRLHPLGLVLAVRRPRRNAQAGRRVGPDQPLLDGRCEERLQRRGAGLSAER
jgi:hypothetical protein